MRISSTKKNIRPKVHLDPWDTWSADYTLACIIVPMLEQLRDTTHGAPATSNEDVPEELRSKLAEWEEDAMWFERWKYILNEMIYAFDAVRDEICDRTEKDELRVKNGLYLFAKYYRHLWD